MQSDCPYKYFTVETVACVRGSASDTDGMPMPFSFLHWYIKCTKGFQYCRPLAANSADNLERGQNYQRGENDIIQDGVVNDGIETGE